MAANGIADKSEMNQLSAANYLQSIDSLWPPHLYIAHAGGKVGAVEVGVGAPSASGLEEGGGFDFGNDGDLRPGLVRNLEEAAEGGVLGEGDVALEEEMGESIGCCGFIDRSWRKESAVLEGRAHGHRSTAAHATRSVSPNRSAKAMGG